MSRRPDGPRPRRPRRWPVLGLKLLVSLGLLAWMVHMAELDDIGHALADTALGYLLLANLLQLVGMSLTASRWGGLLRAQGVHIPTRRLFGSCIVAAFFRQILPSTIGGDVIRAYDSWRAGAGRGVALATVAVDRLLGLVALALFALGALAFSRTLDSAVPALSLWVALATGALVASTILLFAPPPPLLGLLQDMRQRTPALLRRRIDHAVASIAAFRGRHGALARAMALSILLQLNVVAFYWLIGRAMGFPLGLADWLLIVPIATVVMMAPVSINGIGVREGILALLLGAHGVAPADAVAFAWLEYASFLLYGLIGGLVYAARRAGAPPADDLAAQSAARAASGDAAAPPTPATAARASPLPRPARREAIPAASAD